MHSIGNRRSNHAEPSLTFVNTDCMPGQLVGLIPETRFSAVMIGGEKPTSQYRSAEKARSVELKPAPNAQLWLEIESPGSRRRWSVDIALLVLAMISF